jgi:23S rRNA (uracil1939-C5)-methyltransferase
MSRSIPVKTGDTIQLTIERLSLGGAGVARYNGFVVFTPKTAPGDTITAKIETVKKSFAQARLLSVDNKSEHRVEPPCPYFSECGGCDWQNLSYEQQLFQKQSIVEREAERIGLQKEVVKSILPSNKTLHYRNRTVLHTKQGKVGFFGKASNQLVDIEDCLLVEKELNLPEKIKQIRTETTSLQKVTHFDIRREQESKEICEFGQDFAQVNSEQNAIMNRIVVDSLSDCQTDKVFDFYCGSGNFTFTLANHFNQANFVGLDADKLCIEKAKKLSQDKSLAIEFIHSKVTVKTIENYDLARAIIVLDPPRSGLEKGLLSYVIEQKPLAVVYVSCDPMTLFRDIGDVPASWIQWIQPVDMFPQTSHIENLIIMRGVV